MKEVVLDTNVFLRFLLKDIKSQYETAKKIFEDIEKQNVKAWVSILVINEIVWIMKKYYEIEASLFVPKLLQILLLKNIEIIEIDKNRLLMILQILSKTNFDFTDLYLFYTQNKDKILSFDKDFKKLWRKKL